MLLVGALSTPHTPHATLALSQSQCAQLWHCHTAHGWWSLGLLVGDVLGLPGASLSVSSSFSLSPQHRLCSLSVSVMVQLSLSLSTAVQLSSLSSLPVVIHLLLAQLSVFV